MKFTIDTEEIKRKNIHKDVFFHTLCLYFECNIDEEVMKEANHLGYNIKDVNSYNISIGGVNMIHEVIAASENKHDEHWHRETALAMAEIYPKGFRPGTHIYWVSSIPLVEHRLRMLENKAGVEIYKELAVQATTEYVNSFKDDTQYMQTLPNFIFKMRKNAENEIEWDSTLLSTIEYLADK